MGVEYYTNNLDALADDHSLRDMRRQLLSDALDQNEFNTKKRRNEYIGTVLSNEQEADFPQASAGGQSIAVKVRLDEAQEEYLPDFCADTWTEKQKFILLSCHGSAVSHTPLVDDNGERVPKFGDRLSLFFSEESPDFYGRMRDLRYRYPTSEGEMWKKKCPPAKPFLLAEIVGDKIQINEEIFFAFDKWDIKEVSFKVLSAVAKILKANPRIKIKLDGHTDSRGSNKYNMALSKKRVASVFKHLTEVNGVSASQIPKRQGHGETKPWSKLCDQYGDHLKRNPPNTPRGKKEWTYCHAKNRRVEFNIIEGLESGAASYGSATATTEPTKTAAESTSEADTSSEKRRKHEEKAKEGQEDPSKPEEVRDDPSQSEAYIEKSAETNSENWQKWYEHKLSSETDPVMRSTLEEYIQNEKNYRRDRPYGEDPINIYPPRWRGGNSLEEWHRPAPQTDFETGHNTPSSGDAYAWVPSVDMTIEAAKGYMEHQQSKMQDLFNEYELQHKKEGYDAVNEFLPDPCAPGLSEQERQRILSMYPLDHPLRTGERDCYGIPADAG